MLSSISTRKPLATPITSDRPFSSAHGRVNITFAKFRPASIFLA